MQLTLQLYENIPKGVQIIYYRSGRKKSNWANDNCANSVARSD